MKKTLLLPIIVFVLTFSGCQTAKDDDFAIYLLAQDVPVRELSLTGIGQLGLEAEPIISSDDIVSYDKTSHRKNSPQQPLPAFNSYFPSRSN